MKNPSPLEPAEINPAAPVLSVEPSWPYFAADEIEAATRVLTSGKVNYWTGEEGRHFESEFAAYVGSKHALALANGTVALELALRLLGIGPGDEVVTTPRTFIASVSCAVMQGARPVLADVDMESQNITVESINRVLSPRTKAIIAVHLAGWPCDMDPIRELAHSRGIAVLEDCAQAHGATYKGKRVGAIGDIGAFSFCQDKIMTTAGEGGMITLNSQELFEQGWAFKDHGKSYDAVYRRQHAPGFRWLHESFGTNWRLTEVQSAVGRIQLKKLDGWIRCRRENAGIFNEVLAGVRGLRLTIPPETVRHAYYKYYAFVDQASLKSGWTRDRIVKELNELSVSCKVGSCSEIYLERAFPKEWRPAERLPVARQLGETSIMFHVHPTISVEQVYWNAQAVRDLMSEAVR